MYEFGDFRIVPEAWDQIDVESLKRMRGAFQMWMSQNLEWLPEIEQDRATEVYEQWEAYIYFREKAETVRRYIVARIENDYEEV